MSTPTTGRTPAGRLQLACAVALGGAAGVLLRYAVVELSPPGDGDLPWATLAVNVSGTVLLAVLATRVADPLARAFLGSGVLGAFTTMSAFGAETALLRQDAPGVAAGYVALTVLLGLGGAFAATAAARR